MQSDFFKGYVRLKIWWVFFAFFATLRFTNQFFRFT